MGFYIRALSVTVVDIGCRSVGIGVCRGVPVTQGMTETPNAPQANMIVYTISLPAHEYKPPPTGLPRPRSYSHLLFSPTLAPFPRDGVGVAGRLMPPRSNPPEIDPRGDDEPCDCLFRAPRQSSCRALWSNGLALPANDEFLGDMPRSGLPLPDRGEPESGLPRASELPVRGVVDCG